MDESAELRPVSAYGWHKLAAERLCEQYGAVYGVSSVAVRLFSVYGPRLRKQLLWDACNKFSRRETEFFGTGEETRDWVHVEDAARLAVIASTHATPAVPRVNGGGTPASIRQILTELAAGLECGIAPTFSGSAREGDPQHQVGSVAIADLGDGYHRHIGATARVNMRPGTDEIAMLRVGFVLGGQRAAWLGGVTYFRNLCSALSELPSDITPVVLTGRHAHEPIVGVETVRARIFDYMTAHWLAAKALERLGLHFALERELDRANIDVLSHSGTSGAVAAFRQSPGYLTSSITIFRTCFPARAGGPRGS